MDWMTRWRRAHAWREYYMYAGRAFSAPAICLLAVSLGALNAASAATLTLAAAEARLARSNPALAASEQRIHALDKRADAATRLPDPKVSLDAVNLPSNSFSLTQQGMTMLSFGISQEFPPIGKLGLQGRELHIQATGLRYARQESRADLVVQLRRAWFDAVYVLKAESVVREQQALAQANERFALAAYRSGRGSQGDVLQARFESGQLHNDLDVLIADESAARARIAAILGGTQLPDIVPQWPELAPIDVNAETGLARQPLLQQARAKVQAAEIGVQLAKKEYEPSISVGASYGKSFVPGSPNFVSAGISFQVPLFAGRRIADDVDAAGARVMEARFALQDQRQALIRDIRSTSARRASLQDQWSRESTHLLPLAHERLRATLAAYTSAQASLGDVIAAQQSVFTTEMQALRDRRDLLVAQAQLDNLTTRVTEQQP